MAKVKVNWTRKIYGGGRGWHVGSLVRWKGAYHVCFVDGSGHGSGDSQIRVCSSADLETWTSQIALGAKTIDPNLLPVGDRLLVYGVRLSREEAEGQPSAELRSKPEPEYGFISQQIVAATTDGKTWSQPRRCFVMNHDFLASSGARGPLLGRLRHGRPTPPTPVTIRSICSFPTTGNTGSGSVRSSTALRTLNTATRPAFEFGVQAPSETSLCFGEAQRLLAVTRARGYCALLSTAQPPYDQWERTLSQRIALLRLGYSPSGPPRTRHRPQLQQRRDSGYGGPIQRTLQSARPDSASHRSFPLRRRRHPVKGRAAQRRRHGLRRHLAHGRRSRTHCVLLNLRIARRGFLRLFVFRNY